MRFGCWFEMAHRWSVVVVKDMTGPAVETETTAEDAIYVM